jgi:hypothetical protein
MSGLKGKVNANDLLKFKNSLNKMNAQQRQQWNEAALKELAARLLAKVIKRTPVGKYSKEVTYTVKKGKNAGQTRTRRVNASGKVGGTLRRGWTGGEQMNAAEYAASMNVTKSGDTYTIEIINPIEYAPYVEFGHRTANHKGWVDGQFMLTVSEAELQADAPRVLTNKLKKFMGGVFN